MSFTLGQSNKSGAQKKSSTTNNLFDKGAPKQMFQFGSSQAPSSGLSGQQNQTKPLNIPSFGQPQSQFPVNNNSNGGAKPIFQGAQASTSNSFVNLPAQDSAQAAQPQQPQYSAQQPSSFAQNARPSFSFASANQSSSQAPAKIPNFGTNQSAPNFTSQATSNTQAKPPSFLAGSFGVKKEENQNEQKPEQKSGAPPLFTSMQPSSQGQQQPQAAFGKPQFGKPAPIPQFGFTTQNAQAEQPEKGSKSDGDEAIKKKEGDSSDDALAKVLDSNTNHQRAESDQSSQKVEQAQKSQTMLAKQQTFGVSAFKQVSKDALSTGTFAASPREPPAQQRKEEDVKQGEEIKVSDSEEKKEESKAPVGDVKGADSQGMPEVKVKVPQMVDQEQTQLIDTQQKAGEEHQSKVVSPAKKFSLPKPESAPKDQPSENQQVKPNQEEKKQTPISFAPTNSSNKFTGFGQKPQQAQNTPVFKTSASQQPQLQTSSFGQIKFGQSQSQATSHSQTKTTAQEQKSTTQINTFKPAATSAASNQQSQPAKATMPAANTTHSQAKPVVEQRDLAITNLVGKTLDQMELQLSEHHDHFQKVLKAVNERDFHLRKQVWSFKQMQIAASESAKEIEEATRTQNVVLQAQDATLQNLDALERELDLLAEEDPDDEHDSYEEDALRDRTNRVGHAGLHSSSSKDRDYYLVHKLEKEMLRCSSLTAELNKLHQEKAQLQNKMVQKSDQISEKDPNVVITQGVIGTLESFLNVIEGIEHDRIAVSKQLEQVHGKLKEIRQQQSYPY